MNSVLSLELFAAIGSTILSGGLLLWVLQRQSTLMRTTTRLIAQVEHLQMMIEKLDTFRERLALNEAKAEAAHTRMDQLSQH